MKSFSLEKQRRLVVSQAIIKNWNNTNEFLLDEKLKEELKEFKDAVTEGNPTKIFDELVDVEYILIQIAHNSDKSYKLNLDEAFKRKYDANWKNKKKTKDQATGLLVRR